MDEEVLSSAKRTICTTCKNNLDCALNHDCCIWDCSEFAIPEHQGREIGLTAPRHEVMKSELNICASCDLRVNCAWRKDNTSIFYCEHYE